MSQNQNINQPKLNNIENPNLNIPNNFMMNYPNYPSNVPHYSTYNNMNFPPNMSSSNQAQNANKQNQIILVPAQSPITHINQNNSTHPTLLGNALIPILNERPISASQKYQQIINEVMSDYASKKIDLENEIFKKLKKCDMHPKTLSEKCRKCKEIKKEISKIQEEIELQNNFQLNRIDEKDICKDKKDSKQSGEVDALDKSNDGPLQNVSSINQLVVPDSSYLAKGYYNLQQDKTFKFVGDPITCNLNSLLLNNILSCQYFKDVVGIMDYYQLIEEIVKNVTYAEPWTVGTNGIPSTLFCIIYRFMLMKLTESQVYYLINYNENDYVRCSGFLYMRYMSDPKDLWNLFYPYLYDEKMFTPTIDTKNKISFGEYIENLLKDYDYYGTRIPRIPIQIEREIKTNLYNLHQVKNRKIQNEKNIDQFTSGRFCKAVSFQDNNWHHGKILQNLNNKKILILFEEGNDELIQSLEITENKWYNFEIFKMRFNELREIYNNEKKQVSFFSGEEIVDLSNIILEDEKIDRKKDEKREDKSKYKKRSRSNQRSNSRSSSKSHSKRKRRKRSSSSSRHRSRKDRYRTSSSESSRIKKEKKNRKKRSISKSRSRSRSNSYKNNRSRHHRSDRDLNNRDKDKELLERIIQEEKRNALAVGRDYASKPTSYKSSLSLRMPLGNTRKRSKSPSPIKQNIQFIEKKRDSPQKEEKKIEYSEEFKQRSEMLKKQYGNSNQVNQSENYKKKSNDELGPEILKLG